MPPLPVHKEDGGGRTRGGTSSTADFGEGDIFLLRPLVLHQKATKCHRASVKCADRYALHTLVLSFVAFCALFVDPCRALSTLGRSRRGGGQGAHIEPEQARQRAAFETAPPAHCFATKP